MTEVRIDLSFAERLTVALMRAGMTRGEFAEYVGTTRKTVWTWETLRTRPAIGALRVLADEAGVPFEWLRPSPDEIEEGRNQYTPRDSNPEPTDSMPLWPRTI